MKKRKLFGSLISEKNNIKISIILGARQVGKTTILNELYQNTQTIEKIPVSLKLPYNLDLC